ncbi:MAG TPA: AAA family ATPase [Isosphaeraceae bacterium]|nr:AAA family ATPase [Isosphaeraceae bacterium]
MDREGAFGMSRANPERTQAADAVLLESRARALETALAALAGGAGPVLVTGEAGSGKTWLCRRIAERQGTSWRWVEIDLTPTTTPSALFRTLGHKLGLDPADVEYDPRRTLAEGLVEQSADGWRWGLVADEAHTASATVVDELRILANRLGLPDGFAAVLLAGQSALSTRLASQPLSGIATRLAARVHLRPIDADEARTLVASRWPDRAWPIDVVERLHRDAAGNPQRLLRLAQGQVAILAIAARTSPAAAFAPAAATVFARPPANATATRPAPTLAQSPVPVIAPASASGFAQAPLTVFEPSAAARSMQEALDDSDELAAEPEAIVSVADASRPLLGPGKPPIRDEDGLIEVGWEPTVMEMAVEPPSPGSTARVLESATEGAEEEVVDDHYAALQAWNEWAANQGRGPAVAESARTELPAAAGSEDELKADGEAPGLQHPQVWAEGPERFGPYSQLFSRLRHPKGQE